MAKLAQRLSIWPLEGLAVKNNARNGFSAQKNHTIDTHIRGRNHKKNRQIFVYFFSFDMKNWISASRCPKILFFTILEFWDDVEQVLITKNWCQLFVYIFDSCQTTPIENRGIKSGIARFAPGGFSQNLFTKYLLVRPLI